MIEPRTIHCIATAAALALVAGLACAAAGRATAQTAPFTQSEPAASSATEQPASPSAPEPAPAPGGANPFGAIGKWVDDSIDTMRSNLRGAGQTLGTIGRLPGSSVVTGRERCATTAQGSADCRGAAEALCRSKGLDGGRSLDIQSAEKCPARVWLSGRRPSPGECPVESFVTRAMCR